MFYSVDPYTREKLSEYPRHSDREASQLLERSSQRQRAWALAPVTERCEVLRRLAIRLKDKEQELALLITREMGKPILQSLAEIRKCAAACDFFAERAPAWLAPEYIQTEAHSTRVLSDPLGVWLAIMPWNFPFWQVIRCMAPALAAGNTLVLKHASNVSGCANALEELVRECGGEDLLTVLRIHADQVSEIIHHPIVRGVSFTGSEGAGKLVAAQAGHAIKPSILELGGSNAFIVLADADIEKAAEDAITGRFQNNGQSCIAAKRLLIQDEVLSDFLDAFSARMRALTVGDPKDTSVSVGPLARSEFAEVLAQQVQRSTAAGAQMNAPLKIDHALFYPALLTGARPGMVCMEEELFGPVAVVGGFSDLSEAICVNNQSRFGLGVAIYTSDPTQVENWLPVIHDGAVFINGNVHSDPRLPFGGTKASGFGRELGLDGLRSFTNRKTVWIA